MDAVTFIRLARQFSELGGAVGDQATAVICDGARAEDQNFNALEMTTDFLRRASRDTAWIDREFSADCAGLADDIDARIDSENYFRSARAIVDRQNRVVQK
jgi:hypothetical protein